ncbi:DUF6011 domain-containing protein [Tsukamurella strandjordii]|uniref:DUF6011 domain-containing protein n=1 Tax=Tsukamurella strandjordii TaxID=147577 RepID=A0AA90SM73_9ACTN|nr:DUF6011 domain-containing protein [Tsukamurella strandjordii]MDP0398933.1 DUF6011 domain-containing protein [Tsukamurella strandjordii]
MTTLPPPPDSDEPTQAEIDLRDRLIQSLPPGWALLRSCTRCGAPLRSTASVRAGLGPTCRRKAAQ